MEGKWRIVEQLDCPGEKREILDWFGYQFKAGQFRNWGLGIGDWEAVA